MKLFEAMKKVWESDVAWLTKNNALQMFALIGCAVVIFWPWIPVVLVFTFSQGNLYFLLFLSCSALSTVWSCFWFRVFGKWWPF